MKIVILQPNFIPWLGVFEQLRLADLYLHLDDVAFSNGSFVNRVQIKTSNGIRWLTVPVLKKNKQLIKDIQIDNSKQWKTKHLKTLEQEYKKAPFYNEMFSLIEIIYTFETKWLAELNIYTIELISDYFNIKTPFKKTSELCIKSSKSLRVLEIVKQFNGTTYITGHGAKNYLDHTLFENNHIKVEYMDYKRTPYTQLNGIFDPHVSVIDLIANTGKNGIQYIHSTTKHWKDFINE